MFRHCSLRMTFDSLMRFFRFFQDQQFETTKDEIITMPPEMSSNYEAADESDHEDTMLPVAKKFVHFAPMVDVRETLHVLDYEADEYLASWYDAEEQMQMQAERMRIIEEILEQTFVESDEETARGVETPDERHQREEQTMAAVDTVLDEQDLQFQEDIDDPVYISLLYQYCCLCGRSARKAHLRALRDHAECVRQDGEQSSINHLVADSQLVLESRECRSSSYELSPSSLKGKQTIDSLKATTRGWRSNAAIVEKTKRLSVPAV